MVDSEDGDYGPVFDTNGKIKVRGNSTGEYYNVKLPYNIKFSTAENLFGMGSAKKWALLANAFDKTLIRNAIAMELGVAFELDYTSCYKFAEMWLNGKYLGSYMIIENVDVSPTRVDIDIDSGDFLIEIEYYRMETGVTYIESKYTKTRFAINDPETPTQKQLKALTDFVNTVDNAIRKKERDLIEKYIDIQSFVDVYIVEEYLKNVDFYYSSTRFYCKDGVLYAGPIWDFDLSMGNCDYYYYPDYNNIYSSGDSSKGFYGRQMPWYDILFECDWFEELVWERYNEKYSVLENVHTENELGDSLIDRIIGLYGTSFLRNFTESDSTFFTDVRLGREPNSTYEGNVYYMRSWLKRRIDWMTENLCPSHYSG